SRPRGGRDANNADIIIDPDHFSEHRGPVTIVKLIEAGNYADLGSDQVFVVKRPALLEVDEIHSRPVRMPPCPVGIDADRRRRKIALIAGLRIVGWVYWWRCRPTLNISNLHVGSPCETARESNRIGPRGRLDHHIRSEDGLRRRGSRGAGG